MPNLSMMRIKKKELNNLISFKVEIKLLVNITSTNCLASDRKHVNRNMPFALCVN
jgi:hypothetical protein